MRGFLGGIICGALVSAVSLAALSLSTQPRPGPALSDQLDTVPAPAAPVLPPVLPVDTDLRPDPAKSPPLPPVVTPPEGDGIDELSGPRPAGTQPPQVGEEPADPEAPVVPLTPPRARTLPVDVAPGGVDALKGRLAPPEGETAISAETDAAARPSVAAPLSEVAEPVADTAPAAATPAAPDPARKVSDMAVPLSDRAPGAAISDPAGPTSPTQPVAEPPTVTEGAPGATAPEATQAIPSMPRIAALPQAGQEESAPRPSIGTPVRPLTDRTATQPEDSNPEMARSEPPLTRHAVAFDNPEGRPLMSIVLIEDESAIGLEALAEFPHPLTLALDPAAPDAAIRMAERRAAGYEIVTLLNLPVWATAQDAEVLLAPMLDRLGESVAFLEGPETGIQGNRRLAAQVATVAGATGRGLITQDKGLNSAQKQALRDGVPAAVLFRDIDAQGQGIADIRRGLDQAAFRAARDGSVILLGRVRPDTISALLLWSLQGRTEAVALAPVSAVLRQALTPSE